MCFLDGTRARILTIVFSIQYLVLTLGDSKHVTHSVPKTLNPEWNEQCQLPISDVHSLLLDVCCWDKDRFGKDYLGEFDLALEEIQFAQDQTEIPPKWFPLKSKRPGKKTGVVSGEVLLQFRLLDNSNKDATPEQMYNKFTAIAKAAPATESSRNPTPARTPVLAPVAGKGKTPSPSPPLSRRPTDLEDEDEYDVYDDETPEDEDSSKPEAVEKRKRKLRIKGLKRKKRENPFEFTNGGSDVVGIVYLEIANITDLPPESNLTRTTFDMDPFVIASLGKKTYRTKTIRHNLNPVFNEKMIFQVLGHEQTYSFSFTVVDHDKYSGNDFIASVNLPLKEIIDKSPKADPETGLYNLKDIPEYTPIQRSRFMRLGLSRTSSTQSLSKLARPPLSKNPSTLTNASTTAAAGSPAVTPGPGAVPSSQFGVDGPADGGSGAVANPGLLQPNDNAVAAGVATLGETNSEDPDFCSMTLPLKMKNQEKWEDKHNPQLFIRAKYMPYPALRQQFWRAMLKQYDTDESGLISKVELTTMLDTLGSTLRDSTIDSFFQRFPHKASDGDDIEDLTMNEAVICLEDQLEAKAKPTVAERVKNVLPDADKVKGLLSVPAKAVGVISEGSGEGSANASETPSESQLSEASTISVPELGTPGEEGDLIDREDLNINHGEEHVVEIRECPICHQPRLNKRNDSDIITHIATCASQDWRQVNNLMMGGFVTSSQAQRKWYSKVITKISYGGYKLGANSANILVQDRITGQINEEKMSVYVRLGIRLLYKGLKSNNMETKRSEYLPQNTFPCSFMRIPSNTPQSVSFSRALVSSRERNLMTPCPRTRFKSSLNSTDSTCRRSCSL